MKLATFTKKLKRSISKGLSSFAESVLYKEAPKIVALLKEHSPYDKGTYHKNWRVLQKRGFASKRVKGQVLSELIIRNETKLYGQFIESGAEPQQPPWWYPHRDKKTGRMKKGTGKLKAVDGKVWPGGLNPGHNKTVGGAIKIVMEDQGLVNRLSLELSDKIVKGIIS